MKLPITPETKVGALLQAYPELEDTLIALAPAFARLRNPILRRTVAKLATLEQAARVGGLSVRELVTKLREAAGQPGLNSTADSAADQPAPAWLDERRVEFSLDADSLLASGEHPLGKVRQCLAALQPGGIVCLASSFRPEPLIAALAASGFAVYATESAPGRHLTYIMGPAKPHPANFCLLTLAF
jgi:hypothetical protein